jgi:hypothetical protein
MNENKVCKIFEMTEDFGVLDVSVSENFKKEVVKTVDSNGNVVEKTTTESTTTIQLTKPKESTGTKVTLGVLAAFSVTLIGVLSDLPGAIEYAKVILRI